MARPVNDQLRLFSVPCRPPSPLPAMNSDINPCPRRSSVSLGAGTLPIEGHPRRGRRCLPRRRKRILTARRGGTPRRARALPGYVVPDGAAMRRTRSTTRGRGPRTPDRPAQRAFSVFVKSERWATSSAARSVSTSGVPLGSPGKDGNGQNRPGQGPTKSIRR